MSAASQTTGEGNRKAYVYKLRVVPTTIDDPDGKWTDMEAIDNFSHTMSLEVGLADMNDAFAGDVLLHCGENLCVNNEVIIEATPKDFEAYKLLEADMFADHTATGRVTIDSVTECDVSDEVLRANEPGEKYVITTAQKASQPKCKTNPSLEKILKEQRKP